LNTAASTVTTTASSRTSQISFVIHTAKVARYLLHAQPLPALHVSVTAMQLSPQALPWSHTLQQLLPPPPHAVSGAEALIASGTASAAMRPNRNSALTSSTPGTCRSRRAARPGHLSSRSHHCCRPLPRRHHIPQRALQHLSPAQALQKW